MKITKRQREYLDAISEFVAANGYNPTQTDLARHLVCTETPFTRLLRTCAARAYSRIVRVLGELSSPMIR